MSGIKSAMVVGAVVVGVGYATTTTSTTSTITAEGTAASTPTPTPTATTMSATTTASTSIPAGYTVRAARDFGVRCDGVKDDTVALQNALNALKSQQALQLPSGICITSKQLNLWNKSGVFVAGAGKDSTILQAKDPLHSSFIVYASSKVVLSGFQVYSPNTGATQRTSDPNSKGFFVAKSSYVTLDGIKARNVAGAGVLYNATTNSSILNSEVESSHADAFHATGASQNILMQFNKANRAGDDCFASIGYAGSGVNRNIRIFDNECYDNLGRYGHGPGGSAVGIEGTMGAQVYRNKGVLTGGAGLRVASQKNWNSAGSTDIDFRDNVLINARQNQKIGHPAVLVFTTKNSISNVSFSNTTVSYPLTWAGAQVLNYVPGNAKIGVAITNMPITSDGRVTNCVGKSSSGVTLSKSGVTLNSRACG
jgi:hypothetical protein